LLVVLAELQHLVAVVVLVDIEQQQQHLLAALYIQ
jgi:hypothetical protein